MKTFEQLKQEVSEGRIGRREFIKRATALGMAAAIPGALLAEEARAAAPKRGVPREVHPLCPTGASPDYYPWQKPVRPVSFAVR